MGNRKRKNAVEPLPPAGAPPMPQSVKDDPVAKQEWGEIVRILADMQILSQADKSLLRLYCETYSRYVRAHDMVRKYGEIIKTPEKGYPQVSPYMAILNRAQDQLFKLLETMGLTPVARARMAIKDQSKQHLNKWVNLVA
jgi:P27 family predicted phage terminase small subunit